jgi:2-aminoadipate transaminase
VTSDRDIRSLYSENARRGAPIFFPGPPVPVTYNFDQGLAAAETFPIQELAELARKVLERDGSKALEYGDVSRDYTELVYGYLRLRELIAERIALRQGRRLGPEGVILTSGSVQAIALAANGYLGSGDAVILEASSFPYGMRYMESTGATLATAAVDDDGMDVDEVERRLRELTLRGLRPKMIYTIATFQLPTGTCLSLPRRRRLIQLAKQWKVIVLEDNVYGELRYEGDPLPTLLGLDDSGLVIQSDSFSKTVVPGIRLGWMAGHPEAIAGVAAVRQDLGVSQWMGRIMAEYLAEGKLDPHIEAANRVYRAKRDAAVAALRRHCGELVRFRVPQGGFYLWLEIAEGIDAERVRELAAHQGVFCRPGEVFTGDPSGRRFLRMSFSQIGLDEIERGVAVLGEALEKSRRAVISPP